MNTGTIYLNNDYSKVKTTADKIGRYDGELQTVERLLTMGFVFCNHVRLADRQRDLTAEISRLEALRRTERDFMPFMIV